MRAGTPPTRRAPQLETVCSRYALDLSLDQAWDAWTTPGGLQSWWWSDDPSVSYAVDPRVGGRYRIHSAATGLGASATVVAVDRPTRLVLRWRWLGEHCAEVDDLVQVSFAVDDGAVALQVEHALASGLPSQRCAARWNCVLDDLARQQRHPSIGKE